MSGLAARVARLEAQGASTAGVCILWVDGDLAEKRQRAGELEREGFTVLLVGWQGRMEAQQ